MSTLRDSKQPLEGRRLWFGGIGGAGMSGLALVSAGWGAQVSGWDQRRTPYLLALDRAGIPFTVSAEPDIPVHGERIVSSAFAGRITGIRRGDFLGELTRVRPTVAVAGTHGKTTTAAMIAHCLQALNLDPGYVIGGEVPQLGPNGSPGSGWFVVEADESDRSLMAIDAEVRVVTSIDLDHHTTFASRAEVEDLLTRWLHAADHGLDGRTLPPFEGDLGVPGNHNRRNAGCALAALECIGVPRTPAVRAMSEFAGVGRRFELRGVIRHVAVYDDYAHHPTEIAAVLATARSLGAKRVLALFQPHLFSRTRHLASDFGRVLAQADIAVVTDVYPAREEPEPNVSGKLIVDAIASQADYAHVAWTPTLADGARYLARRARAGDVVLTLGAGDVHRAAEDILAALGSSA